MFFRGAAQGRLLRQPFVQANSHRGTGACRLTQFVRGLGTDDAEHMKKSSNALSGWRFWPPMILAGHIGKFVGLFGGVIFLGLWWLVEWLWKKKA